MCTAIHVDPLSSSKGYWADILGIGDYYFELGVKIVQISLQTRSINGGIIELDDLVQKLKSSSTFESSKVSSEDIVKAVSKLSCLGNGYRILEVTSS